MINTLLELLNVIDKYLAYLDGKIEFSNTGYPIFRKNMFLDKEPDMIVPYYNRNNSIVKNPEKTVICSYCGDNILYPRVEKIFDDIDEYKRFQGVIGLDITVTADMDLVWQNALMLLNQLFLAVLACNGIHIVMNARTGAQDTVNNFMFVPKNVMWATGFLGCKKMESECDYSFLSKILCIMPSKLLIYGKHDGIAERQLDMMGIDYRVYSDFHRISKGVA